MNLLLDTATFLWLCADARKLSPAARSALGDPGNTVAVSAVTAWEIGLKAAKKKLKLPAPLETWFPAMVQHHRLLLLPIDAPTAMASTQLPEIHFDPFDRLLVATASARGLRLATPDPIIAQYPNLQILW